MDGIVYSEIVVIDPWFIAPMYVVHGDQILVSSTCASCIS